ncbi:MAG: ABC transporter permease [Chloroflexi bacterium]|nr:ABC transporter permease [Chloroflexota bacterium]
MHSIIETLLKGARFKSWLQSAAMFLAAALAGLLFGALIIWASGKDFILAYRALLQGAFGNLFGFSEVLMSTTPLLFAGLAVAFAFHCGLFNIGVEGQLVVGGLVAGWAGYAIQGLPWILHFPLSLALGMLAGAFWGLLAGLLKAWRGVHEVINTIMLNYIAFHITSYLVSSEGPLKAEGQLPATPFVLDSARLPRLIPETRFSGGIFIALLAAVLVGYLLWKTRLGYRIRAVGKNPDAAEFGGISPKLSIIYTMAISGGLAGLAGAVEVLGLHYRFYSSFSPGYGFDAIAIALMGNLHPLGITLAALLFGILRVGSIQLQQTAAVSKDIVFAISGIIIFFIALRGVFADFRFGIFKKKVA